MKQISFDDQTMEVTNEEFLLLVQRVIQGGEVVFHTTSQLHSSGFPDVTGKWSPWISKERKQLCQLASQIDNKNVSEMCQTLDHQLQKLEEFNKKLVEIVASYFNFSPPRTKREQTRLKQAMDKLSSQQGPLWISREDYQNCIHEESEVFQIVERIMKISNKLLNTSE